MTKYLLTLLLIIIANPFKAQNSIPELTNASTPGTLKVTVTTSVTGNTAYDPENIVAIWIQDSSGKFVKTLLAYAGSRKQYLTNWNNSSSRNIVDAITGSTKSSHATRDCEWNATNTSKAVVVDGTYTIKMELTDKNSTGNVATFTFTKSPIAQTLTPSNAPSFSNISIKWAPTATGIESVELAKMYSVYPNPTLSNFYVTGFDIQEIEICTLAGKSILKTNEQKVNISSLPKGLYLVRISSKRGIIIKKVIKV